MARGSKAAYTDKQKRMAEHIEESEKKRGVSDKTAARIGWATVNKETGGGLKKRSSAKSTSKKPSTTRSSTSEKRSAAAKKGWATRRKSAK